MKDVQKTKDGHGEVTHIRPAGSDCLVIFSRVLRSSATSKPNSEEYPSFDETHPRSGGDVFGKTMARRRAASCSMLCAKSPWMPHDLGNDLTLSDTAGVQSSRNLFIL